MPHLKLSLLFSVVSPLLLSQAYGMIGMPCENNEHDSLHYSSHAVTSPAKQTPTLFLEDQGVEIDYQHIQVTAQDSGVDEAFARLLDTHIPGKRRVRLMNVFFDQEKASHLSHLLQKSDSPLEHIEFVRCGTKNYTSIFAWNRFPRTGVTVEMVIGMPEPRGQHLEPNMHKSHKTLAKALEDLGISISKSSMYKDVIVSAASCERDIQKIESGTENVTVKHVEFDEEKAFKLLYLIQSASPLSLSSAPYSVKQLRFEGCTLASYSALNAFTSQKQAWERLGLTVGFVSAHDLPSPNVSLPKVLTGSTTSPLKPAPEELKRFFEGLQPAHLMH